MSYTPLPISVRLKIFWVNWLFSWFAIVLSIAMKCMCVIMIFYIGKLLGAW